MQPTVLSTKTTNSSSDSREYGLRGPPRLLSRARLDPKRKRQHPARVILGGWTRITFPAPFTADQAVTALNNADFEVEIRRNYILETNRIPNDTHWTDGTAWALRQIGAPYAWDTTVGSREIVVAVLDTGVDISHPDLANNIWSNLGEIPNNGRDDDSNGFVDDANGYDFVAKDASPIDESYAGHGTAASEYHRRDWGQWPRHPRRRVGSTTHAGTGPE